MRDEARLAARLVTGRQLNGDRKTNARWNHPGTELRDGAEHAGWWAHLSLRRRAAIRLYALVWLVVHAVGLVVDFDRTVITLRVEVWAAIFVLAWVVVHKTRKSAHHNGVVVPVAMVVADWLGMSRHGDPRSLVTIPLGHRTNPDKPVRVHLPAAYREPDRRQAALAKTVASRAGIKSHDWEVQLEGPAPVMLVRAMLVPPDEVLFAELAIRAIVEANDDPSRLFLGLGLHGVPLWLDWDQDSPHLALSIGSGGGKSTTVRSLAAQTVRKGGRAVLCDGGKDGESHQDWARDENLDPIPGVDFHPSIAEEHDALIAWEAERARRARAVLNRTGETFQRVLIVLEERNLTTPKLAAYWAAIRDAKADPPDPVKSPAIQATANLVAAGRSVNINVVGIAQRFDANVIGGGAVRSSFGLRVLSRFDEQARRMLIPEITPKPKSSNHRGRMLLCVQGEARELQGTFMTPAEAVEMCREGGVPVGTCGVPTSADRGGRQVETPAISRENDLLDRPHEAGAEVRHLHPVPDYVTVSLADFAEHAGLSLKSLRNARDRDTAFPLPADTGPRNTSLYRLDDLESWADARMGASS